MAPMGDDAQDTCRWAALAGHEAAVADSDLVDLPPSVQVARGKELLSMLGCGSQDAARSPAAPPKELDRKPQIATSEMDAAAALTGSMSRHLDSLTSQPQEVQGFAPASAMGIQQVVAYDGSEWMVQGGFGSRTGSSTPAAQSVPLWGGSTASGSVHTASAGTPWPSSVTWSMTNGATVPASATAPVAVLGQAPAASVAGSLWPAHAGSSQSYASGWTAGALGSAIPLQPDLQCAAGSASVGVDLVSPVPVPMVLQTASGLEPTMLNRNQMRAEAAPYVPGSMPLSVGA
mmetsp:Transcript_53611/g.100493  ORF Transcript_53611/g.100493 Transcript_53611/m.100493 type:complete len:289 (+) Transcript_53611:98-964(+)